MSEIESYDLSSDLQQGEHDLFFHPSEVSVTWDCPIYVPSEVLSEEDEGDLEVLRRKLRKRLRHGMLIANYGIIISSGKSYRRV